MVHIYKNMSSTYPVPKVKFPIFHKDPRMPSAEMKYVPAPKDPSEENPADFHSLGSLVFGIIGVMFRVSSIVKRKIFGILPRKGDVDEFLFPLK